MSVPILRLFLGSWSTSEVMSDRISHFTDLELWRKAHQLFVDLVDDVDEFPDKLSARVMADHILRSGGSIPANVAEGFLRPEEVVCGRLKQTIEVRKMTISLRQRIDANENAIREPETEYIIELEHGEGDIKF